MASQMQYDNTTSALVKLRESTAPPPPPPPPGAASSAILSSAAPPGGQTASIAPPPPPQSAFVWSPATDKVVAFFASQVDTSPADLAHIVAEIREKDGVAPTIAEVSVRVGVLRAAARQKKQ
ncbi:hypothetical protein Slin14017_G086590 [Septoria linicola]|nr:hypothetical protein Slin14017_G086590 [Septoria linicola]